MAQKTHTMHGRDHLPSGADPMLPAFPTGDTVDEKILAALPAGFWKLNETTGSIAHDSSGDGQDMSTASPELDPLWGAPAGPPGEQAADFMHGTDGFGGTAARVSRSWPSITGDFTAGIWVSRDDDLFTAVMGQGIPHRSGGPGWELGVTAYNGLPVVNTPYAQMATSGAPVSLYAVNPLAPATWAFLAIVYDHAAGVFRLYVDGLLEDTSAPFTFAASSLELWVGHDGGHGNAIQGGHFTGSYAFLVNRAMSGTELAGINDAPATGSPDTIDDLVLGDTGDGTVGWVQPKVDVTVNGETPAGPSTTPPPSNPVVTPPPSTGTDGDDWIYDQPFLWDGSPFDVEPNQWTTIPFTDVIMVRYSNQTSRGGTCDIEIDPADPAAGGWVDPAFPHAITVPHDFPIFADGFSWIQVCLFLETPEVLGPTSYRQLRVFETTHQKTVLRSGQFRYTCCIEHGATSVFRDPTAAGWTPPADGTDTFAEGDVGGFDNGGHDRVMFAPNSGYGWRLEGDTWLPKNTLGASMLTEGMRLVAQVWHDAPDALTFDAGGTVPSFGTPAHAPYRPHFCVFQQAPRAWGSPWSDWPTYP